MGLIHKIVNILVLIFAIASVVLALLLFQKREKLVNGWKKLTEEISKTAAVLDKGSGTKIARKLEPEALAHTKYEEIDKLLPSLQSQATSVIDQRDALAEALAKVASTLQLQGAVQAAELKEIEKYAAPKDKMLQLVAELQERNNKLINEICGAAKTVGVNLTEKDLGINSYKKSIGRLTSQIRNIKTRSGHYENHIRKVASLLNAPNASLKGAEYKDSLRDVLDATKKFKSEHEQTVAENKNLKDTLGRLREDREQAETKANSLKSDLKSKENEIVSLNQLLNKFRQGGEAGAGTPGMIDIREFKPGDPAVLRKLKGKVVEVNRKWDFVVVNIGKKTTVKQKIGKKAIEVDAMVPKDIDMIVARNLNDGNKSEFVAKIKLVKVYDNCSIANILPSPRGVSTIRTGDTVYFPEDALKKLGKEETAAAAGGTEKTSAPEKPKSEFQKFAEKGKPASPPAKAAAKKKTKKEDNWENWE